MLISAARKIHQQSRHSQPREGKNSDFLKKLSDSIDQVYKKSQQLVQPVRRGELPVSQRWDEIAGVIKSNQVSIICGHTGSGKTTKIPQICLDLKLGSRGKIAHTQPRRIAARSVAARISEELKVTLGKEVGYKVRFDERHSADTDVLLLTDGMLLAEIERDKFLNKYEVIIIDEAHERSLNIDFLLGYIKKILHLRTDLKVVITSATIDAERFSSHFNQAPIINVEGKTFPIDIIHKQTEENPDLSRQIINAVHELDNYHYGDTLVFLPTERDIRDVANQLEKLKLANTQVLSLFARQSKKLQASIFNPASRRRIILATNVAETSITVPRILNVIDSGLARISRYSYRSKIQRLPIEKISKASAAQRSGRCGRIDEGVCIRLYDEEDFNQRPDYTQAEILRTSLAAVILKMQTLGFGKIDDFPFIDPPENKMINDGYKLLFELKAIDEFDQITLFGKKMAQLPIDPRFACVLLHAAKNKLLPYILPIVCALVVGDIKERPDDAKQKSDQQQRVFKHKQSDLLWFSILFNQLWPIYKKSKNKARQFSKLHFLSIVRTREWLSLYEQLSDQLKVAPELDEPMKYLEKLDKNYRQIHCSLAAGFLDYIGQFNTQYNEYTGTRAKRFSIFPGSYLFKKRPAQIMAIEMVESSKVYARQVAQIDLNWLEPLCGHLYKTTESEPVWKKNSGNVMVKQTVLLYGLPILSGRLIPYYTKDLIASHRIFIEQALVANDIHTRVRAVAKNRDAYERLMQLEDKSRSREIVIDEIAFAELYANTVPEDIYSVATFEKWFFKLKDKSILDFSNQELLLSDARVDANEYPEFLEVGTQKFPLFYEFNPGSPRDGITTYIKSAALNSVDPIEFEYLIPAMLEDKIEALLRTLPKQYRKKLLPVSDYVQNIYQQIKRTENRVGLLIEICNQINKQTTLDIRPNLFELNNLDDHYKMNFVVTDHDDAVIDEDRNLVELQTKYAQSASRSFSELTSTLFNEIYDNVFPEAIPKEFLLKEHSLITYPCFCKAQQDFKQTGNEKNVYQICLENNQRDSIAKHRIGTAAFIKSKLSKEIKQLTKNLPQYNELALQYQIVGENARLLDDISNAIILTSGLAVELPYTKTQMQDAIEKTRLVFFTQARKISKTLMSIVSDFKEVKLKLDVNKPYYEDITKQLTQLVYPGFIANTEVDRLQDLARYIAAITIRLEKAALDMNRDQRWQEQIAPYCQVLDDLIEHHKPAPKSPDSLQALTYLLEEYRISLFAQNEIKTAGKVSAKRIDRLIEEIKQEF